MKLIDNFLSTITMYRLMFYFLLVHLGAAIIFSGLGVLPFSAIDILTTTLFLVVACWGINQLFAKTFKVAANFESQFITAFILALILGPMPLLPNIGVLTVASFLAMGSKYIVAFKKQHFFNPAAFAVVGTGVLFNINATWWAGGQLLLPLLVVGGLLIVRKIRRFHLVFSFMIAYATALLLFNPQYLTIAEFPSFLANTFLSPVILFFTFVMLTEPITSPADRMYRIFFGAFAGIIYVIYSSLLPVAYTLELALISANLVGRIVRFSTKYNMVLQDKREIGPQLWEFLFRPTKPISFVPGQYLEWNMPHSKPDARGNRRYFTIASSPTEKEIKLAVKVPDTSSTYKKALLSMSPGDTMYATNLEGEFVLKKNPKESYVFIAGGIGITPFRSIIQYLLDKKQSVPIALFYTAHNAQELVFQDVLDRAKAEIGLQAIYVLSEDPPPNWTGETGHLAPEVIQKYVPDYKNRHYYISGPQPMVMAYQEMVQKMDIPSNQIKVDFFPGYT